MRAAEHHQPAAVEENEDSDDENKVVFDEKMGAKKRAKLEAKAEKKAAREAELKARDEQKKRDGRFGKHPVDFYLIFFVTSSARR